MINSEQIIPVEFSEEFSSLNSFISTKSSGNAMLPDCSKTIALKAGVDHRRLTTCSQVHGNTIMTVTEESIGNKFPASDGLITNLSNVPIAVFTADCLSVFLFDPKINAIGIVHAGRKGTQKQITQKAIKELNKQYNSIPENIFAAIGPCICAKCYEYDLINENRSQLLESGIKAENIKTTGLCSKEDGRFFSYRGDNGTGNRMISIIVK